MNSKQSKTIVLIDDDPITNMISTKIILRSLDCKINAFTNAQEALDQLKISVASAPDNFPEIIFLDINMPHMDGWEFLEEFQKLPDAFLDRCDVLMLTSSIDMDDLAKSKTFSSVKDFISKPLTTDKLGVLALLDSAGKNSDA